MVALDTTTVHFSSTLAYRLVRTAYAARDLVAERKLRHDTRKALSRLSDRELDDIGLARADILRRF